MMKTADKDEDQLLNKGEFREFFVDDKSPIKQSCGDYSDPRDVCNEMYNLLSQITPEVEGISPDDYSVFFMQIWFPTWCRLLIKDYSHGSSHQTYEIWEDSHLGQELLKEKQVKKEGEN